MIVAMDQQRAIGKGNTLPWRLPADLKRFKQLTLGQTVLMGRKTFDSIGKPLPQRRNVVLTRDPNWRHDGVEVIHALDAATLGELAGDGTLWVIGGAEIYRLTMDLADRLEITAIDIAVDQADAWFPEVPADFVLREQAAGSDAGLQYRFLSYQR
jgi:dihydrofolate reductase